ncbi:MAG: hypothetical protein ACI9R3_001972 [Verrucomicrobiales bacterium]|jgi:hypothetical protein
MPTILSSTAAAAARILPPNAHSTASARNSMLPGRKQIRIAYEAGPTGFVLVRRLLRLGYDTIVVASSKMERAAGEKVKDAIKIARQLRGKMLKGIYIPEAKTEAVRDLCCVRTDASEAKTCAATSSGSALSCFARACAKTNSLPKINPWCANFFASASLREGQQGQWGSKNTKLRSRHRTGYEGISPTRQKSKYTDTSAMSTTNR